MANQTPSDPFSAWREWVNDSERQLNAFFNQLMGSDRYSQFLGRLTDMQIGMQKNTNEALTRFFSSLNLPTRDDLAALNQRLGAIEDRLHVIEATLGAQRETDADAHDAALATPRPPRTKRPSAPVKGAR